MYEFYVDKLRFGGYSVCIVCPEHNWAEVEFLGTFFNKKDAENVGATALSKYK